MLRALRQFDILDLTSRMPMVLGVFDTVNPWDAIFKHVAPVNQDRIQGFVLNVNNTDFSGVRELCGAFVNMYARASHEDLGETFAIPAPLKAAGGYDKRIINIVVNILNHM